MRKKWRSYLHKRANIVTTSSNFKGYILIKSLLSYDSYPLYMRERERERGFNKHGLYIEHYINWCKWTKYFIIYFTTIYDNYEEFN